MEGAMFRTLTALCCLGAVIAGPAGPPGAPGAPAGPRTRGREDPGPCIPVGPRPLRQQSDSCWDFTSGIPSNAGVTGEGVSWSRPLYNNVACAVRGVLKLTPPSGATQLKVHMRITHGNGWQFNLGDSPTCNGYSGDGGTAPVGYNAEFQKLNNRITLYKGISYPQQSDIENADIGPSNDLTIRIKKGFVWATNYNGWMMSSCNKVNRLFYWDAMYLGINRVVSSSTSTNASGNRVGHGLCKLCIEWE